MEPGATATNDRRPDFQKMMEAGTAKPLAFDVVIVHSFSRFFRDHFELEFYVRKLAKNGVQARLDDPGIGRRSQFFYVRFVKVLARLPTNRC